MGYTWGKPWGRLGVETGSKTHHVPPGVAPARPSPENVLVSRATGKISSPFGAPLMYSGWAYVPRKRLMFHGAYVPRLCSRAAYVPPAYVPGWGLCSTDRAYVPPNDRANRPRCLRLLHLERPRPICFPFLARHAKSSALLAFPRCTAAGLMFHRKAYVPPQGLMFHQRAGRNAPGPSRSDCRAHGFGKLSRFSRDR